MTPGDLEKMFQELSDRAVELAKGRGVDLNFSNESVEKVESLLDILGKEVATEKPTEEQMKLMATIFGAYLGNTLIKNLGKGKWEVEPTNNAFGVNIDGKYMFFPAKVYRRIKNGPEENVVAMYQSDYNGYSDNKISLKVF